MSQYIPSGYLHSVTDMKSSHGPLSEEDIKKFKDSIELVEIINSMSDAARPLLLHRSDDDESVEVKQILDETSATESLAYNENLAKYGCDIQVFGVPSNILGIPVVLSFTPDQPTEPDAAPRYSQSVFFNSYGYPTFLSPVLISSNDQASPPRNYPQGPYLPEGLLDPSVLHRSRDAPALPVHLNRDNSIDQNSRFGLPKSSTTSSIPDMSDANCAPEIKPDTDSSSSLFEEGASRSTPGYKSMGRSLRHVAGSVANPRKRPRDIQDEDEEEALRPTRRQRSSQPTPVPASITRTPVSARKLKQPGTPRRRSARIAANKASEASAAASAAFSVASPRCLGSKCLGRVLNIAKTAFKKGKN